MITRDSGPEERAHRQDDDAFAPIKDYALIGDCGSAALVSKHGSVDWLCWPRFDSPSIFARILDRRSGGYFRIAPTCEAEISRQYIEDTNVLQTTFRTRDGTLRITDLMPVAEEDMYNAELWPDHELLRQVECVSGSVEIDVDVVPMPDYGRKRASIRDRGPMGYVFGEKSSVYAVRSELPLERSDEGDRLSGRFTLQEGASHLLSLSYDHGEPAVFQPLGERGRERIDRSVAFWRQWAERCVYTGPFRDAVVRSALTLKLMTYSRSGAIVAAPTTSLPEKIGGVRNWDYRFCWLRDASLTLRALFELGYREEGRAFFHWLMYTAGQTGPGLNVLYDVYGNTHGKEIELEHFEGYRGSRPVRIGNKAEGQLQLDIFGEVISAAYVFMQREGTLSHWQIRLLVRLGSTVCDLWREPDSGIWEIRSGRRHHTYSKALCWVALHLLLDIHERTDVKMPVDRFREEMDAIRDTIENRGYSEEKQSYVSVLDTEEIDASLLLLPIYGYTDADTPRMRTTFERIQEELAVDGLMYRYPHTGRDGLPPGEGAFGLCSFWDEEMLARSGEIEQAKVHFGKMLSYANDVGLFGEEIDVETGAALGNFPQAFTHIGLINAAVTIDKYQNAERQHGEEGRKVPTGSTDAQTLNT